MSGRLALLGSGEYLPSMERVERALLDGRPPRMAQLATAAAPEGPDALAYWHRLGRDATERLEVEQVVVPVTDRASADAGENAALLGGVGLVYLSGGNPTFLADALRGTAVWSAILSAWEEGAALAGCSAGAMALCGRVPSVRDPQREPVDGLGLLPHLQVLPHFDRFARWLSSSDRARLLEAVDGVLTVGIEEETALIGDGETWQVVGRGRVVVFDGGEPRRFSDGEHLDTPRPAGS